MRKWIFVVLAASAFAAGGSARAAAQQSQTRTDDKPKKPKSGGSSLITQEEIEYSKASSVLEAIERIRPAMLRVRMGAASDQGEPVVLKVYLDHVLLGDPQALSSVSASSVKEIRLLSATDATQLKGTGHMAGALIVTSKSGR